MIQLSLWLKLWWERETKQQLPSIDFSGLQFNSLGFTFMPRLWLYLFSSSCISTKKIFHINYSIIYINKIQKYLPIILGYVLILKFNFNVILNLGWCLFSLFYSSFISDDILLSFPLRLLLLLLLLIVFLICSNFRSQPIVSWTV